MAVEILGILLASAGASYALRAWQRRREPVPLLDDVLAEDASIAMSVATHEAGSRSHPEIWPIHMLYGLLQDETFTAAITKLGGDPEAIEARVLGELERKPAREHDEAARVEALRVLAYAHGQRDRKITSTDLWAYLARTATGKLVESGDLTCHALLFVLVHGMAEPPATLPDRIDVHVVMRNDDYTTRDFVVSALREVFDQSDSDAEPKMMQVHNEGRGIVGRFKTPLAAMKIETIRKRAREQTFPLWIAPEDC